MKEEENQLKNMTRVLIRSLKYSKVALPTKVFSLTWDNAWCPSSRPSSRRRPLVVSKIFPPHSPEKTFNLSHLIDLEKDLATVPSGSSKKDGSAIKIYDLIMKWLILPCLTDSSLCQKPSMESVKIKVNTKFGQLKQENLGDSGRKKRRKGRTTAGADTTWVC